MSSFLFEKSITENYISSFEKTLKLMNSSKFHFPKIRKDVILDFKKSLQIKKFPIPKELK